MELDMRIKTRRRLVRLRNRFGGRFGVVLGVGLLLAGSATSVFADFPGKITANSVVGNPTSAKAQTKPVAVPSCTDGSGRHLNYTLGTGFSCGTSSSGGGGTVSSVTFTGDGTVLSSTPSSAVTSSGTVTATLLTKAANLVLAGPASGGAAEPTYRALVSADLPAATVSAAGASKLHNVPVSIGWPAALNPNNTVLAVINQASTISGIIGAVETATGGTSTVSVYKAPSGTACSGGTVLHSGSFNANGTAATNQTLTVTTASLAVGDRLCLQTTGTTTWTGGSGIGTITVFLAPS
jgi:hypothetical protein